MRRLLVLGLMLAPFSGALGQSTPNIQSPIPQKAGDLLELHKACQEMPPDQRVKPEMVRNCMGFTGGVVSGALVYAGALGLPPLFCPSATTTDSDVQNAIIVWTEESVDRRGLPASVAVMAALAKAYPCATPTPTLAEPTYRAPPAP